MKLSFIIPTYNSFSNKRGSIELTLTSLLQQNIGELKPQIIVIDNGCTDNTLNFLKMFKLKSPWEINVINCPKSNAKALARNLGVSNAKGDILFFIDDDMIMPNRNSINLIIKKIDPISFACGVERRWTYIGWNATTIKNELHNYDYSYALRISHLPNGINRDSGYLSLLQVSFLANFGCLYKELFYKVGGFDERYFGWGRHDCDLMYRLLIKAKSRFINCFDCGPVIHLNHAVENQASDLNRNEKLYKNLEIQHGVTLRYSHLFGLREHDDSSIFIPIQK